ncbi:hypothetical protein GCM10010109_67340 [Actinoplanes campanulatus]|nr:hypothetical protein GCM10010109_67340 [Actinoplanes campanulatus]
MPVLLPGLLTSPSPGTTGLFPEEDLELTCEAAWGADLDAEPDSWEWTDLSDRVIDSPISITRGVLVGGRTSRGTSGTVALLNEDGWLSLHHPGSPWWPHVDAGTPVRISVRTRTVPYLTDTFTRTVASGWGTAEAVSGEGGTSWLNTSGLSVDGTAAQISCAVSNTVYTSRIFKPHRDVDVTYDVASSVVTTGGPLATGPTLRASTSNADHSWPLLEFQPDASLRWALWRRLSGSYTQLETATIPGLTYTVGTVIRVRFLLIGARLRAKAWLAAGIEPGEWTLDYTFTDAALIAGGNYFGIAAWPISTLSNPLPVSVSIDNLTITQPRYPRIEGYIADIKASYQPVDDETTHSIAVIDIGGVGTRLELRDSDAWSPMRRSIQWGDADPVAYWHCEDADRATQAASGITGQPALQVTGPVVFSFDTGEPEDTLISRYGSKNLCSVAAGARLSTAFTPSSVQNEWTVGITAQVIAALVPVSEIRMLEWSTLGTFTRWALVSTATGHEVRAYNDVAGTSTTACSTVNSVNALCGFDVQAVQAGANIDVTLLLDTVVYAAGSVAGTLGAPHAIEVNPDRANTTGSTSAFGIRWLAGHVVIHDTATASSLPYYYDDDLTLYRADQGWYREPTHLRADRVSREGRVPFRLVAEPDEVTRLNSQQEGTTPDLLVAAVEAESGGLLYEAGFGYEMLPRVARYNRAVDLTIDLATYRRTGGTDPAEVLQPQLRLKEPTIWTVQRTGGSQAMWAADAEYRKRRGNLAASKTLDLLEDGDLLGHAQWRIHLVEDARGAHYPGASIDLTANPDLIDDWLLCAPGARVQRINQPLTAGLGTVDQVAEGLSETLGRRTWVASIEGAPAEVWDVGLYDDAWLADSVSTTLVADQPATSVGAVESWQISTALLGDVWETVDVGYVWESNGEEVTVTAMGAVTGSGPYLQTATVERGANGIVKAHRAGDLIQLADPATYSL